MSVADGLSTLFGESRLSLYALNKPFLYAQLGRFHGDNLLFYPEATNMVHIRVPLGDIDAVSANGLITRSDTRIFIFMGAQSLTWYQRLLGYRGLYMMLRLEDGATHEGLIGPSPSNP